MGRIQRSIFVGIPTMMTGCLLLETDPSETTTADTGTPTTNTTTTTTTTVFTTQKPQHGFSVVGQLIDLNTEVVGPGGSCVSVVDPTPVFWRKPPEVIATTVSTKEGAFVLDGLQTVSKIGLWISVDDCDNEVEDALYPARTYLTPSQYSLLGDGDVLEVVAVTVAHAFVTTLDADLAKLTSKPSTLAASGFLWGSALDDLGAPLGDIVVACPTCYPSPTKPLYADADPADGLFTTNGKPNLATSAAADGAWMVVSPTIGAYSATDTSGSSSFVDQLVVAEEPGFAVIVSFVAQPPG
ncbi:MAG: hypothetical protein KTR31_37455 [Myxococcales bacterium]|nr:hypothetical protein [Myxococcales bacterium]